MFGCHLRHLGADADERHPRLVPFVLDAPQSGAGRALLLRHGASMHLFQGPELLLVVLAKGENRLGMLLLKLLDLVAGIGLDLLDGLP